MIAHKQVPTATSQQATTQELLEAVSSVVRAANVATQPCGKHASITIEELCFLRGPCRWVINGVSLELSLVVGYSPDGKDVSEGHVKISHQETITEDREDFTSADVTVIFGVCNSVRLLQLRIVTI
jgi:hypothetical protein